MLGPQINEKKYNTHAYLLQKEKNKKHTMLFKHEQIAQTLFIRMPQNRTTTKNSNKEPTSGMKEAVQSAEQQQQMLHIIFLVISRSHGVQAFFCQGVMF